MLLMFYNILWLSIDGPGSRMALWFLSNKEPVFCFWCSFLGGNFSWLSILLNLALTSGVSWPTAKQFLLLVSISLFCFKIGYFSCCFLGIDSSLRYEILCCSNFVEDFLFLQSVTAELEWLLWSWTAKQFLLSFVFTVWRLWFSNSSEHLGCMFSICCTCIDWFIFNGLGWFTISAGIVYPPWFVSFCGGMLCCWSVAMYVELILPFVIL